RNSPHPHHASRRKSAALGSEGTCGHWIRAREDAANHALWLKPLAGSGLQFDKLEVIRHLEMGTAIDLSHHRWPEFARRCRNLDVVHAGQAANIIQLFREVLAKNAWY